MTRAVRVVSLVLAGMLIGGVGADAATRYIITKSSQIKPGAIAAKNLSAAARRELRGQTGAAGTAGAVGAQGPAGAPGKGAAIRRVFYPIRFIVGATSDEFPMTCPDGTVAIGGGAGTGNSGAVTARTSQPGGVLAGTDATPSVWYLYVVSNSSSFNYTPYVICAG